jgi:hypothetical protein
MVCPASPSQGIKNLVKCLTAIAEPPPSPPRARWRPSAAATGPPHPPAGAVQPPVRGELKELWRRRTGIQKMPSPIDAANVIWRLRQYFSRLFNGNRSCPHGFSECLDGNQIFFRWAYSYMVHNQPFFFMILSTNSHISVHSFPWNCCQLSAPSIRVFSSALASGSLVRSMNHWE